MPEEGADDQQKNDEVFTDTAFAISWANRVLSVP